MEKDSLSYWQQTAPHLELEQELPHTVDVAVIGGGLLGSSIGYWLARAGVQVALLERDSLAYGATGRNGGFMSAGTKEEYASLRQRLGHEDAYALTAFTYESKSLVHDMLSSEQQVACHYREVGGLRILCSEQELEKSRENIEALQQDGFAVTLLSRAEVQERLRTPLGSEIVGGIFKPKQAVLHSTRFVQQVVLEAQRLGLHVYQALVQKLQSQGDSVLVQTNRGMISAKHVIVATNAWTSDIVPELKGWIVPTRAQMLAYAPLASRVFPYAMSVGLTAAGEYWQQTLDGSIVIGGYREASLNGYVNMRESLPTAEVQQALERILPQLFPQLPPLNIMRRWAGLMAFTADTLPIVDTVPQMEQVWAVAGFSGHGMPFGLLLGKLLAQAVTEQSRPTQLRFFRLDRPALCI